jgi:DNA-binding NarL/FixJ family response regulator
MSVLNVLFDRELKSRGGDSDLGAALTTRERQVLALIAAGRSGKQIAAELGITLRTARAHREKLARKLGTSSTAWLTRYAIEHGMDTVAADPAIN